MSSVELVGFGNLCRRAVMGSNSILSNPIDERVRHSTHYDSKMTSAPVW